MLLRGHFWNFEPPKWEIQNFLLNTQTVEQILCEQSKVGAMVDLLFYQMLKVDGAAAVKNTQKLDGLLADVLGGSFHLEKKIKKKRKKMTPYYVLPGIDLQELRR